MLWAKNALSRLILQGGIQETGSLESTIQNFISNHEASRIQKWCCLLKGKYHASFYGFRRFLSKIKLKKLNLEGNLTRTGHSELAKLRRKIQVKNILFITRKSTKDCLPYLNIDYRNWCTCCSFVCSGF